MYEVFPSILAHLCLTLFVFMCGYYVGKGYLVKRREKIFKK